MNKPEIITHRKVEITSRRGGITKSLVNVQCCPSESFELFTACRTFLGRVRLSELALGCAQTCINHRNKLYYRGEVDPVCLADPNKSDSCSDVL